jgi:hypothetical protein
MNNGMSTRVRHIVVGLAAFATTALITSTLVESFDPRLLRSQGEAPAATAETAELRRDDRSVRRT